MCALHNLEDINEMDGADQWQTKLCKHCRGIDFNRIMNKFYTTDVHGLCRNLFQFGTIDEVSTRASQCQFCDIVSKACNTDRIHRGAETRWWLSSEPRYVGLLESRRELRVLAASLKTIHLDDGGRSEFNHHQFNLLPAQPPLPGLSGPGDLTEEQVQSSATKKWPVARALFTSTILRRMKNWRDLCHTRHGDACELPIWFDPEESPKGLRLLDVEEMRIVQIGTIVPPYAVLSYVSVAPDLMHAYTTQSANLSERTGHKGFLDVDLPQTIKEAISLLPQIGLRYLWVDALCVVQDDVSDKAVQVAQRDILAARAELTLIVAPKTSGSDGLASLDTREPLQDSATVQVAGDLHFQSSLSPAHVHMFNNSNTRDRPWYRYASSLQQSLNSKRALIFTEDEVFWECLQDFWCQGIELEPPERRTWEDIPGRKKRASSRFEPEALRDLMFRYIRLRVSPHPDGSNYVDILASILRRFTYTTGEAFHWGLPCNRFSSGLTWLCSTIPPIKIGPHGYAIPDPNPEQRRLALYPSRGTSGSIAHIRIPSWSWLGWLGALPGFCSGVKQQVYHEPKWYKLGLNNEAVPVPTNFGAGTDQLTGAPWHGSQSGLPPDFEPTPSLATFVDSGKIGAWVSTAKLRVSDKCETVPHFGDPHGCAWCSSWDVHTLDEHPPSTKNDDGTSEPKLQLQNAALHWSTGPEEIRCGSDEGGAADYDFIAVAHDNRCEMCFGFGVTPPSEVRSHVRLVWVEWKGEEGKSRVERKGACCIEEEVWMKAEREWKWVVLM